MSERGPIVCGTDLSAVSQANVEVAARMAAVLDRPLHLVFVTGAVVPEAEPASEAERVFRERLHKRVEAAERALDKAAEVAEALGPHVEKHVLSGRPWEAMIAYAEKVQPSVLAIGPHGHSGAVRTTRENLSEWLIGSTADRVIRHSKWPVLVGPRDPEEHARQLGGGTWIVAVDFSDASRRALRISAELAGPSKAKLVVAHALSGPFEGLEPMTDEPFPPVAHGEKERVESELGGFVKGEVDDEVELHLRVGEPAHAIADSALDLDAKLIVMGTHGRSGLAHLLLGSVAERVLRRAPCPVLIVPT